MKNVVKTLFFCLCMLALGSCGASKHAAKEKETKEFESFNSTELMKQVKSQLMDAEYLTAKMKFNLRHNDQNISVGGHLRMKTDDVIQLSLVAFGFVEAARIELTKEDVLVVDRINKRYVRAPYSKISFLKEAELDFNGLQSMFRNELFVPGKQAIQGNEALLSASQVSEDSAVYSYQNKKLKFQFLVGLANALVQQVRISSAKGKADNAEFNWNYSNFQEFGGGKYLIDTRSAY